MTFRFSITLLITLGLLVLTLQAMDTHANSDEITLELSDEVRTALDAGVVLSFNCRFAVRDSWWVFKREKQSRTHRFTLTRHALSNRYIIKTDSTATPHISRSVTEATNFITAEARKLLDAYSSADSPYSMRLTLNKFELPTPMRLKAFIDSAWDVDTGWVVWNSVS